MSYRCTLCVGNENMEVFYVGVVQMNVLCVFEWKYGGTGFLE